MKKKMKKKIILLSIGICFCLTGCGAPQGLSELPAAPENEASHNESSGLIVEMPEHEKVTTDPEYFDKYGNKENADQVRSDTDAGYDKVADEYGPKDEQARKDGEKIKKEYENEKANGKKDILNKQDQLEQEMKDLAEQAKEDAKKVIEE